MIQAQYVSGVCNHQAYPILKAGNRKRSTGQLLSDIYTQIYILALKSWLLARQLFTPVSSLLLGWLSLWSSGSHCCCLTPRKNLK